MATLKEWLRRIQEKDPHAPILTHVEGEAIVYSAGGREDLGVFMRPLESPSPVGSGVGVVPTQASAEPAPMGHGPVSISSSSSGDEPAEETSIAGLIGPGILVIVFVVAVVAALIVEARS